MRLTILGLVGALGVAVAAPSAQAAPNVPSAPATQPAGIIKVWGGCGWGFRPVPGHWSPWRGVWVPPHCAPIRGGWAGWHPHSYWRWHHRYGW